MIDRTGQKLLIVDDFGDVRSVVSKFFRRAGYIVVEANGAKEALSCLEKEHFDLVVTDVGLGDGNGIEMVTGLDPSPKAIFMSGYMQPASAVPIDLEAGRNLILKPFRIVDLARIVQSALATDDDSDKEDSTN